ncbi:HD domain-containing phosphohydrolase [Luteitalea sp.]|jgi:response regulator RpfG family c-di-GMP phosphodiesterase|uniref:HD domain-containing phosphohydrolase n=1 Tax=Luteitalea sp. TaxID=2004800 RepID=UPI0037CCC194
MMARLEPEQPLDVLTGGEGLDEPTPVLVIDDGEGVREVLSAWVEADGCRPVPVTGADEALAVAAAQGIAVALCDVQMPGHDGFWFLEQVQRVHPDMAVVLVTGVHDVDWALRGLQHGVVDYLLKPFDQRSLSRALENGMRQHRLRRADRLLREQRASELGARHRRLIQSLTRLEIATTAQVEAALDLVAFRSDLWREHSHRVRRLAVALATTLRIPPSQLEALGHAALLHELGRLVLPDGLLSKTGELTAEERALWRRVPDLGASILEAIPALRPAAGIVRSRFEEYAGGGYPRQLSGDEIPMTSRLLAVADSYDAMRSPRPFRDSLTHEQAVGELVRGSGTQFDPDVVRTFTRMPGLGDR